MWRRRTHRLPWATWESCPLCHQTSAQGHRSSHPQSSGLSWVIVGAHAVIRAPSYDATGADVHELRHPASNHPHVIVGATEVTMAPHACMPVWLLSRRLFTLY